MNKNRGFTLIEIMAVVILLGIVAVISVPVVKDVINDAKQKGFEKQINTVLESAKNWAVKNSNLLPEGKGSILVKMDTLKKEGFLENKKIINSLDKSEMNGCAEISYVEGYNQYEYTYNENCKSYSGLLSQLATTSQELDVNSVATCATDGTKCDAETEFAIKVNDNDIYKFYVVSDKDNVLTMIMDRNLGGQIHWISREDYNDDTNYGQTGNNNKGPITALNYLNIQTTTWTNIPMIKNYTYNNNLNGTTYTCGYQKLEITNGVAKLISQAGTEANVVKGISRARLLTDEEVETLKTANSNTLPQYLYTNLGGVGTEYHRKYWLLTANKSNYWIAGTIGYLDHHINGIIGQGDGYGIGIRPVIEISKLSPAY